MKIHKPPHPGEILRELCLEPMGLSVTRAVEALGVTRKSSNKAWVLGDDRFRAKIEKLAHRQAAPKARGGDRKSEKYQGSAINRV